MDFPVSLDVAKEQRLELMKERKYLLVPELSLDASFEDPLN
jgi:hypothetical protein